MPLKLELKLAAGCVLLTGLLSAQGMTTPHTHSYEEDAQSPESAKQMPGSSADPAFAEPRRLSQQGKFDEAIGQLEALAAKQPDLKGLSHELGIVYYKKGDYLKAVASFKKALEEDPGDSEAIQLMGLSYYLAGRPSEAIAP